MTINQNSAAVVPASARADERATVTPPSRARSRSVSMAIALTVVALAGQPVVTANAPVHAVGTNLASHPSAATDVDEAVTGERSGYTAASSRR